MNGSYLFLFHVGPVQSFIAQARKTRDLYTGSHILSALVQTAMSEAGHPHIVFPFAGAKAVPNRFVAFYENTDLDAMRTRLESIEAKVRGDFKTNAQNLLNQKEIYLTGTLLAVFDAQIQEHLEIFWAIQPIDEGETYRSAYNTLEKRLGSLKNARIFRQHQYDGLGEAGRKCSVDGTNNALFFGKDTNSLYTSTKWNPNALILKEPKVLLDANEGLGAVSFVKRFSEKKGFDAQSVAQVALKHWARQPENRKVVDQFERFFDYGIVETAFEVFGEANIKVTPDFLEHFDYQFLYSENVTKRYLPNESQCGYIEAFHKKKINIGENRHRYYAVLTFDGDNMGKWLSGAYCSDTIDLLGFQRDLSKWLSDFAQKAIKEGLPDEQGLSIYAGGDDFIGMVCLHDLFEVLGRLRTMFHTEINLELQKKYPSITKDFTFSAGIAVAHYKMPLDIVLKEARRMQHRAKQEDGKNAFAISLLKRSGENHEARIAFGTWENNKEWSAVSNIKAVLSNLKNDFSDTFIRSYQREFAVLSADFLASEPRLRECELKRLLHRSQTGKKDIIKTEDFLLLFKDWMGDHNNLVELLNILNFVHRQTH